MMASDRGPTPSHLAAREGFEPPESFPSVAFKATAIGRSATSPDLHTVAIGQEAAGDGVTEALGSGCRRSA